MPRPGSAIVHPGMLDRLRPVAEGAMAGTCELLRPSTGERALDDTTGTYVAAPPTVLWTGPCRVQPRSRSVASDVEAGGEMVTLADYQVTVPVSAPAVGVDDLVRVLTSVDPQLADKTLRITDVATGDYQLERQLTCEDDQG